MPLTKTFKKCLQTSLEIQITPLAFSTVYLKIFGNETVGVGSTTGRISGASMGNLYYNHDLELSSKSYKMYCIVEDNETLRIDFLDIPSDDEDERASDKKPEAAVDPEDPDYKPPTLVFRGACPPLYHESIEPFIGVIAFEVREA